MKVLENERATSMRWAGSKSAPGKLATRVATALFALLQIFAAAGPATALYHSQPTEDGGGGGGGGGGFPPFVAPVEGFNWKAPNRYKQWVGAWRQQGWTRDWKVETYDPNYVNPKTWELVMMACKTNADYMYDLFPDDEEAVKPTTRYQWKWNGHTIPFGTNCYTSLQFPAQGTYWVQLTVKYDDGDTEVYDKTVSVKDHLIVVLGDSSASGEGAPDQRLYPWSYEGARAEWVDNRCHRSANAGGAQAARRIEESDPYSSVTFLSFACSGATLNTQLYNGSILDPYEDEEDYEYRGVGITGPYAGIEPLHVSGTENVDFSQKLPGQVDQLWTALKSNSVANTRKIDALIVAGGINDARFADLATVCLLYDGCPAEPVGETPGTQRILGGELLPAVVGQFEFDVARVPSGWDVLGAQLGEMRQVSGTTYEKIKVDRKLALQYPPFFHDENGARCQAVLHDAVPGWVRLLIPVGFLGWDALEVAYADTYWAPALDAAVRLGSERNGFTYIDTIADRFYYHGICASENWINTPTESGEIQGDDTGEAGALASVFAKGTAHPNTDGYAAYADEIIEELVDFVGGSTPPVAVPDKFNAGSGFPAWINVLDNDTDADGDTLTARVMSKPQHGHFEMTPDGNVTYTPNGGYIGPDSFTYEVSDGVFSRFTYVDITVEVPFKVTTQVILGGSQTIGGLIGSSGLFGPFQVVLDRLPRPGRGDVTRVVDQDAIHYQAPIDRRRSVRLPYTVYSQAPFGSPGYGESVRGVLRIRVVRRLHGL